MLRIKAKPIKITIMPLVMVMVCSLGAFGLLSGCTKKSDKPVVWIYTSLYNHVIQDLDGRLQKALPDISVKWYQSGSENVAAKVNSEILAGKPQADLILTSDPFWYESLKVGQKLLAYDSPAARGVSPLLKDADFSYVTVRVPLVVIAYHREALSESQAPQSFEDLKSPRFKNKIAMGNPLESGTVFTAVTLLIKKFGWDYFTALRANGLLSAGGNSAVFSRIETKERPVGIVLLENALAARRKNPKIGVVIPKEGVLMVPSPVAILNSTQNPEAAKKVYDFLFSAEGQEAIVRKGDMHSPLPGIAAPEGAPTWNEVLKSTFAWDPAFLQETFKKRDEIKRKFSQIVLE